MSYTREQRAARKRGIMQGIIWAVSFLVIVCVTGRALDWLDMLSAAGV